MGGVFFFLSNIKANNYLRLLLEENIVHTLINTNFSGSRLSTCSRNEKNSGIFQSKDSVAFTSTNGFMIVCTGAAENADGD